MARSLSFCLFIFFISFFVHDTSVAQLLASRDTVTSQDSVKSAGTPQEYNPKWYSMISNLPGDWLTYSRVTFKTKNIPLMIGVAASTGILLATDDRTWHSAHNWYEGSDFVHRWSDNVEWVGDGRPQFGIAGVFAVYGFAFQDERALRTSSEVVEAILACGGVVQLLKHVTGRQSPYVSSQPGGEWVPFPNQWDYAKKVPYYDAFPSGHLSTALTVLTVVVENYPEASWYLKPIGYTALAGLGVSMVNTGIHWYSDYPLAIALGYEFGMIVSHPLDYSTADSSGKLDSGLSLSPKVDFMGEGIALRYGF
ncbi:MAG TPA: phosphatase PAP2 family protein [Bacteroidota bacterium]|nr:phosphatase PAP2 family protein [Bacteroidota bacterium]